MRKQTLIIVLTSLITVLASTSVQAVTLNTVPSLNFGTGKWQFDTQTGKAQIYFTEPVSITNSKFSASGDLLNVGTTYTISAKIAALPDGAQVNLQGTGLIDNTRTIITNQINSIATGTITVGLLGIVLLSSNPTITVRN